MLMLWLIVVSCSSPLLPLKSFTAPEGRREKKKRFLHQFPINILCCRTVETLVIFCLLCSGRCSAEGAAPNKLRSPRWRVGATSEPRSATSLACTHTGICSIMNPNMTARKPENIRSRRAAWDSIGGDRGSPTA